MFFIGAAVGGSYQERQRDCQILTQNNEIYRHPYSGGGNRANRYNRWWPYIYSPKGSHVPTNIWHNVNVSDVLLSVLIDANKKDVAMRHRPDILNGLPFSLPADITHTFKDGHTERCKLKVRPDGVFALDDQYYVVEFFTYSESIDAGTFDDKKSILRSFLQYRDIMRTRAFEAWGIPNLKVMFVFDSHERLRNALTLLEELKMRPSSFVFYAFPDLAAEMKCPTPIANILDLPGIRAGHPAWYLNPKPREEVEHSGHRKVA
jgi:hypothetical protein